MLKQTLSNENLQQSVPVGKSHHSFAYGSYLCANSIEAWCMFIRSHTVTAFVREEGGFIVVHKQIVSWWTHRCNTWWRCRGWMLDSLPLHTWQSTCCTATLACCTLSWLLLMRLQCACGGAEKYRLRPTRFSVVVSLCHKASHWRNALAWCFGIVSIRAMSRKEAGNQNVPFAKSISHIYCWIHADKISKICRLDLDPFKSHVENIEEISLRTSVCGLHPDAKLGSFQTPNITVIYRCKTI